MTAIQVTLRRILVTADTAGSAWLEVVPMERMMAIMMPGDVSMAPVFTMGRGETISVITPTGIVSDGQSHGHCVLSVTSCPSPPQRRREYWTLHIGSTAATETRTTIWTMTSWFGTAAISGTTHSMQTI